MDILKSTLMNKRPTGTKEWAEKNINLFKGRCPNKCIYCYAGANITRYKQGTEWKMNMLVYNASYNRLRPYTTMYPSAHDIRPENISDHVMFLLKFLKPGNKVLIVTKPWIKCIEVLTFALKKYKHQIVFRFTVGSTDEEILKFYEPNAPTYRERKQAIISAYLAGYMTTLSIEPMLDHNPERIIEDLHKYITGDIWIGKMRHAMQRCKMNGCDAVTLEQVRHLVEWQENDGNILSIVNELKDVHSVKWKDSIIEVLDRSFHIIYTISGIVHDEWKQFDSFDECENWIRAMHPQYYEIGIPEKHLPVLDPFSNQ